MVTVACYSSSCWMMTSRARVTIALPPFGKIILTFAIMAAAFHLCKWRSETKEGPGPLTMWVLQAQTLCGLDGWSGPGRFAYGVMFQLLQVDAWVLAHLLILLSFSEFRLYLLPSRSIEQLAPVDSPLSACTHCPFFTLPSTSVHVRT